jgi:23S rRNA (guanine745-N1)-methyltransferase
VIADIVPALRCPHCRAELAVTDRSLRCAQGHSFDIARQGYVALTGGRGTVHRGDSAEMIAAREDFLSAGHLAGLREAIADDAAEFSPASEPRVIVDAGAGTGYYLAGVLDRLPDCVGVALDASKAALRRSARAHARIGAVGCDIWSGLPLADACACLLLDIFSPRNGPEYRRVIATGGHLIVVTPGPDHLQELVDPLGLIGVDPHKAERLETVLSPWFTPERRTKYERTLQLRGRELATLVSMGPSARHLSAEKLRTRIVALLGSRSALPVTFSVALSVHRAR